MVSSALFSAIHCRRDQLEPTNGSIRFEWTTVMERRKASMPATMTGVADRGARPFNSLETARMPRAHHKNAMAA